MSYSLSERSRLFRKYGPWAVVTGATSGIGLEIASRLAEALAIELKPYGVDVLAAAPGPVSSGFANRAGLTMSMSLSPAQVGIPILKALGRQSTVLPGSLSKLLVYSLRTLPRWAKVRIMAQIMSDMSGQHKQHSLVQG